MHATWIDIRDRLPDSDVIVLIHVHGTVEPVWVGYVDDNGEWRFADGMPADKLVTHWMELPEPPKLAEAA